MNLQSHSAKTLARVLWLVFGTTALTVAIAADPPAHIRGTIVSATPETMTVRTSEGSVSVAVDSATKIVGIVPSSLGQIKTGTFVGIANVPGTGTASALEVVVFPDAMKGSGAGDYPWDLSTAATHGGARTSAMTNGSVKSSTMASGVATGSAMTNGTVKNTSDTHGLVLTVDYGNGEKTIEVPSDVPVVGVVPADSSKLLTGAHVFVSTKKDAPKSAAFVAVGIDGTVPPM
jgi:hypothetical protein